MTEKQYEPLKKLGFWRIEKVLRETGQSFKVFSSGGGVRVGSIYDPIKENRNYYAEGANFDELIGNLNKVIIGDLDNDTVLYFTGGYPNSKMDAISRESTLNVSFDSNRNRFVFNQTKYNFHRTPRQVVEFCMKTEKNIVFHDIYNPGCYWDVQYEGGPVSSRYLNNSNPDANKTSYDKLSFEAQDLQTLFELAEVASEMYENV